MLLFSTMHFQQRFAHSVWGYFEAAIFNAAFFKAVFINAAFFQRCVF
jgi:hypothetical protein